MNDLGTIQTTRDITPLSQDPDPIFRNNLGWLDSYKVYNPFDIDNIDVSFNGYHLESSLYTNDEGEGFKVGLAGYDNMVPEAYLEKNLGASSTVQAGIISNGTGFFDTLIERPDILESFEQEDIAIKGLRLLSSSGESGIYTSKRAMVGQSAVTGKPYVFLEATYLNAPNPVDLIPGGEHTIAYPGKALGVSATLSEGEYRLDSGMAYSRYIKPPAGQSARITAGLQSSHDLSNMRNSQATVFSELQIEHSDTGNWYTSNLSTVFGAYASGDLLTGDQQFGAHAALLKDTSGPHVDGIRVGPQVRYDSEDGVSAGVTARFDI